MAEEYRAEAQRKAQLKSDKARGAPADATSSTTAQKRSHDADADTSSPTTSGSRNKKARQGIFGVISAKQSQYSLAEIGDIEKQALRAIVSSGAAFGLFENEEVKKLFDLIRPGTADVLPSRKVVADRLLKDAAKEVEDETKAKSYPIDLVDATALAKDGPGLCSQFEELIDKIEADYKCIITHFITDADGGSLKGRKLLQKLRPYLFTVSCTAHQFQLALGDYFKSWEHAQTIAGKATDLIGWINNHSKVRVLFDEAQRELGRDMALAYLVACITRWTTHFIAFARLYKLKEPITKAVAWKRREIVAAQVGASKSMEAARLAEDANAHCDIVEDTAFWDGLEQVLGDIEVICYATNLAQADSTRADQVLLSMVGIFLRFSEHPEEEVRVEMVRRLEKRWSEWDQALFLLALILNPWEGLSCFGHNANLDHFKVVDMIVQMYRRLATRPGSNTTIAIENAISKYAGEFLAGVGCFSAWNAHVKSGQKSYMDEARNPRTWWQGYLKTDARDLALLAETIFGVVVNQAAVERVFSFVKETKKDRRNRLGLVKTKQILLVNSHIRSEHRKAGLLKERKARNNHKSISALLDIPRYGNLLQDQEHEDPSERGRALVTSPDSWRVEMAVWISESQKAAEEAAEAEDVEEQDEPEDSESIPSSVPTTRPPRRPRKWVLMTLEVLFGTSPRKESLRTRMSRRSQEEEEQYMRVIAELDAEDTTPDAGAQEIDDSEVWGE
ncbi:ribonuclease H-like domain-containing protein [Mycena amicta]|nr:ribonuclease H-like domain-containing protein [Mycena amicta]